MVDIIIPVYNASQTLPKTLDSIINQKVSCDYIVTIIDDCSSDDYSNIINEYKDKIKINYKRLDKNGGAGIARNEGLKITSGEYIVFLDSDDLFYDENSLEKLYINIKMGLYDTVVGMELDESNNESFFNDGDLHAKIYRRKYIEDNNIHFNNTRIHEDNYFNSCVKLSGARELYIEEILYIYCKNDNSVTNSNKDKYFDNLEVLLSNVREVFDKYPINKNNVEKYANYINIKYRYYNRIYFNDFNDKQKETFKKWIRKYDNDNYDLLGIKDLDEIKNKIVEKYRNKGLI